LNLDNPEDVEMISRMLEETDEEEDENCELYLSDDEKIENQMPDNNLSDENTDSISFTHEELYEPLRLHIIEEALIHELITIECKSESKQKIRCSSRNIIAGK